MVGSTMSSGAQSWSLANLSARTDLCFHSYHRQGVWFHIVELHSSDHAGRCILRHPPTHFDIPGRKVYQYPILPCIWFLHGDDIFCCPTLEVASQRPRRLAFCNHYLAVLWCWICCHDGTSGCQYCRIHKKEPCFIGPLHWILPW